MDEEDFDKISNRAQNPHAPRSVYQDEFKKVFAKRAEIIKIEPEFLDVISGPYIDPILFDSKISDESKYESADNIYKRLVRKYPVLKKVVLCDAVDQSKLINEYKKNDKSIYEVDYSFKAKSYQSSTLSKKRIAELSIETGHIPLTTHRRSYREWKKKLNWDLAPAKPRPKQECSLGITWEEQQLLSTTTGKSEYEENISILGDIIKKCALYGDMKILPHEYRKSDKNTNTDNL